MCEHDDQIKGLFESVDVNVEPDVTSMERIRQHMTDRINQQQTIQTRKRTMRQRYGKAGVGLAAAATIAVAFFATWPSSKGSRASAAEVLRQGLAALANLESVYIKANIRTMPRDNFELIGPDYDFVPNEMWKQFGKPVRWRVEKPGRVVVMDGELYTLLMKPNYAARGGFHAGFVGWLMSLLDVDKVLDNELRLAEKMGWDLQLTNETGQDGLPKLVVTIEAEAQGDFTNDWMKNKTISASDNRRIYRFDAETKLLEDLEVWVHTDDGDVLVLETTQIDYNIAIDPDLFVLTLPEDVIWHQQPKVLDDNEKYAQMSPQETARAFFQACSDEDWDEVLKYWTSSEVPKKLKNYLGGLEIISIGEPFKSGRYPGWFVPYEIKLKSGKTKKFKLAVRNDNPAKRYIVDGGF